MKSILTALQEGRLIELPDNDKGKSLQYLASLIEAIPDFASGFDFVGAVSARERGGQHGHRSRLGLPSRPGVGGRGACLRPGMEPGGDRLGGAGRPAGAHRVHALHPGLREEHVPEGDLHPGQGHPEGRADAPVRGGEGPRGSPAPHAGSAHGRRGGRRSGRQGADDPAGSQAGRRGGPGSRRGPPGFGPYRSRVRGRGAGHPARRALPGRQAVGRDRSVAETSHPTWRPRPPSTGRGTGSSSVRSLPTSRTASSTTAWRSGWQARSRRRI